MKTKISISIFFIAALLFTLPLVSNAQNNQVFTLAADKLENGKQIALDKLAWKYQPGDDLNWANPAFDDASWETLSGTILTLDNLPKSGWNGIGWFRLRLKVDEALTNQQLALIMDHWGASEVYVNGKLINQFGKVGATAETEESFRPNKIPVLFDFHGDRGEHLIAVRHSVMALRHDSSLRSQYVRKHLHNLALNGNPNSAGVEISLGKSENAFLKREAIKNFETGNRFWRVGLILMIGILFLLLYVFYPNRRVNLYFSIFAFNLVAFTLCVYLRDSTHYELLTIETADFFTHFFFLSGNIFLLVFLYTAFAKRIPKYFWVLASLTVGQVLTFSIFSRSPIEAILWSSALLFAVIESLRIVITALIRKQSGALIVGVGMAMFSSLLLLNISLILNFVFGTGTPLPDWFLAVSKQISTLGATIPIAVYLARQFAQTNKNLEVKLVEVEAFSEREIEYEREKTRFVIVEAENERRAKELEEARQLQLSMLPKKLPVIPNLEIAAYMKPATEVGGDYYDFHVGEDGTLTVAVGDATGHGLKAGTVVTATKSLFANLAHQPSISEIFKQTSAALKSMNLRGLFMAMTMLKIKDNQVDLSIAGMPSVLVYRSHSKAVEDIAIRAMPLGSLAKTKYQEQQINLSTGDVIVIMSDGFPEMFNAENEMLGFEKAAEILPQIAMNSAQEIINHLVKVGEDWASERAQDDDVTFVVLKVGNNGN